MQFVEILKRAWTLTWRYKILWLFGLLAGTGGGINFSGSGSGGSGGRPDGGGASGLPGWMGDGMSWRDGGFGAMALQWLRDHAAIIALVLGVLFLVGFVLFVISIAARGGLIRLSARADDGEAVSAGDGWRVGFHYWWRTLGTHLVIFLPILAVLIVGAAVLGVTGFGAFAAWGAGRSGLAGTGLVAFIGLLVVFLPFLFVATIAANLMLELALRHAILAERPVLDAVGAAWRDLRGRFVDVFLMWIVMLIAGFAFGIVILLIGAAVLGPALVAGFVAGRVGLAILLGMPGLLVLLIPVGIYGAWRSTAWTLFWRRLAVPATPAPSPAAPPPAA
ncbi:MAG: hypothetical protein U0470_09115 [Anaerolineae bacterium]